MVLKEEVHRGPRATAPRWARAGLAGAAFVGACIGACSGASGPASSGTPDATSSRATARGPAGIYAYFVVESYAARPADKTQSNLDAYFAGLYVDCAVTVNCAEADSGGAPSAEQTLYNMMQAYFDQTPFAASFGVTKGQGLLNFFQIYAPDIFYAQGMQRCISTDFGAQGNDAGTNAGLAACTLPDPGSTIVSASGVTYATDQQLLEQASGLILQMAEAPERANGSLGDAE